MQLTIAHIGSSGSSHGALDELVQTYLQRCSGFARCAVQSFRAERSLLDWLARQGGRTAAIAIVLDSRGRPMSSESFAEWIGARRQDGAQHLVFAVGPASGWSDAARQRAQLLLSLGPMTLAHSLVRLVLAEQIYRAVTILTGHPYHGGH